MVSKAGDSVDWPGRDARTRAVEDCAGAGWTLSKRGSRVAWPARAGVSGRALRAGGSVEGVGLVGRTAVCSSAEITARRLAGGMTEMGMVGTMGVWVRGGGCGGWAVDWIVGVFWIPCLRMRNERR